MSTSHCWTNHHLWRDRSLRGLTLGFSLALGVDLVGQLADIEPSEVGALRLGVVDERHLLPRVVGHEVVVGVEVREELVEPVRAFPVRGLIGDDPERIQVGAVMMVDSLEVLLIRREEVRALHGRQAERLADGLERHAVVDDVLVGKARERDILVALGDEVAMDLVGEDHHAPLQAQPAEAQQVLLGPDVAGGILGVAEDERVGVDVHLGFEVIPVDGVLAIFEVPEAIRGHRERFPQVRVKAAVDRGRHQDLAAGRAKRPQRRDERRVDASGEMHRVRVDLDAVPVLVPGNDGLRVGFGRDAVSPILVLTAGLECPGDARSDPEVHVGDTHRDFDVLLAVPLDLGVPFRTIRPGPIIDLVEIVDPIRRFLAWTQRWGGK